MLKNASDIIKRHEGLQLKAYLCPAGVPTIGYGTTRYKDGRVVCLGDEITETQAEEELLDHIKPIQWHIRQLVKIPLTPNQEAALVSFIYNVGIGNFRTSTLLKVLNTGRIEKAADEFGKWVFAKGKRLNGLVKRRLEEKSLFLRGNE